MLPNLVINQGTNTKDSTSLAGKLSKSQPSNNSHPTNMDNSKVPSKVWNNSDVKTTMSVKISTGEE